MEDNRNSFVLMRNLYPTFHKVEKKIADLFLEQSEKVVYMSIKQIAEELNIAESSIVRFCKTLGIEGFKQLKINLAKNMEHPENLIYKEIKKTDSRQTLTQKVFLSSIEALKEGIDTLDIDQFDMAVDAIINAKRIEFFGVGTSAALVQDAYTRFMRIGFPAYATTDPHFARMSAATMDKDSLAIGISYKGRSRDTIEALKTARGKGAVIMCITCFPRSPITSISDICIAITTSESKILREAISSRIALIALIDSLYTCVAVEKFDSVIEYIENISDILNDVQI